MASLNQYDNDGCDYYPVAISPMQFKDSLRFHARLDVQSMDAPSADLMNALTWARQGAKRMKPKDKISLIKALIGG